jgi:hypothetical protein
MAMTRQQLEQQLVAAHRTQNVQAAQQAAYAIRAYDQNILSAQVPSINAPPPIDRVPKPTFGSYLENLGIGYGEELGKQVRDIGGMVERGVSAFRQDPLKASAAAFMSVLEPARQGFTQPVQTAKDVGAGVVETGRQMATQAQSGPIGLGGVAGQIVGLPGPDMPGRRKPTMAELDVYHGTPHTFDPEEGAPLGRFRSQKIGTGEGAQVYGYGLYLAEAPGTAKTYQAQLSADNYKNAATGEMVQSGRAWQDATKAAQNAGIAHPDRAGQIATNIQDWVDKGHVARSFLLRNQVPQNLIPAYEAAIDSFENLRKNKGSLYKVDLPDAKIEQMLDWDKPLSQQSDYVLERLGFHNKPRDYEAEAKAVYGTPEYAKLEELMNTQVGSARVPDMTGEEFYQATGGNPQNKSEYLRALGIPGIKYLDQGSRGNFRVQNKYKGQNYGEAVSFKTEQQAKDYAAEQVAKGFEANVQSGTRNFVVFPGEEQSLTVLERNGERAVAPKAAVPVIDTTKPKREQLRQLHQQSGVTFVDSTIDRGGAHTPAGPTSGSPAYDVSLNGTYPEDFYGANGLRYYGTGYDAMDSQAYDKLRRLEGNPNAAVEVYRAVEKNGPKTISPGDWVTTVRDYAKDHGESALNGDYKIIKMLVNARDIYTAGDSMLEYGYHPQPRMPQLPKGAK